VDANQAACTQYGYTRERLIGMPLRAASSPTIPGAQVAFPLPSNFTSVDEFAAYCDGVIRNAPQPFRAMVNAVRADGSSFPAEAQRHAVFSDNEWFIAIHIRDMTERRRAEQEIHRHVEELTRSNRELAQFANVISHDLSEPLRMVGSFTQLLRRRYEARLDGEGLEFMQYVIEGARRMQQLMDDLLAYARVGRAGARSAVPLDEAVDAAIANLHVAIAEAGARIERGELPVLMVEPSGMVQLFQNLIANAIKFVRGRAPVVRIQATETPSDWRIDVSDNGIGIAPEYFERIFVIFQRLHSREQYAGTGVGLAICRKIVERHGGNIAVTSAPGVGSTFTIVLPKAAD
jgi:light-regulated signal transduction histidine kinase (bacteriophytochrome)